MTYIVTRNGHFYVVAYDGVDPISGRELRHWHTAGTSRADADAIAATLDAASTQSAAAARTLTVQTFLVEQWMPRRRCQLRPSTGHRYAWMIEHHIWPRIGAVPLRPLRADHRPALRRSPYSRRPGRRPARHQDRL